MKRHSMWLAVMVLIAASLACAVPFVGIRTIKGSGNVVTEERDISGFDRVALSGFGEVIITQGDKESLTVETDDNLMRYMRPKSGVGRSNWASPMTTYSSVPASQSSFA